MKDLLSYLQAQRDLERDLKGDSEFAKGLTAGREHAFEDVLSWLNDEYLDVFERVTKNFNYENWDIFLIGDKNPLGAGGLFHDGEETVLSYEYDDSAYVELNVRDAHFMIRVLTALIAQVEDFEKWLVCLQSGAIKRP